MSQTNLIINPDPPKVNSFRGQIEHAINCFSKENGSNTPDFIPASTGLPDPAAHLAALREALEGLLEDYTATLAAYNAYRESADGMSPVPEDTSATQARTLLATTA